MTLIQMFLSLVILVFFENVSASTCDTTNLKNYANYAKSTLCTGATVCNGNLCTQCQIAFQPWSSSTLSGVEACFNYITTDSVSGDTTSQLSCYGVVAVCTLDGGPYAGAPAANVNNPKVTKTCNSTGSIVQTENQVLGESVPVVGLNFSMNYFTHWMPGRVGDYTLTIPLAEGTIDSDISSFDIEVKLDNAVLVTATRGNTLANAAYVYAWDGKELGVPTLGSRQLQVKVTNSMATVDFPIFSTATIGSFKSELIGLGGWLPSIFAFLDTANGTLYKGDGSRKNVIYKTTGSGYYAVEEDGTIVYYFDLLGRVKTIKTGFTGATIYTFNYDSNGHLISIDEPFGRSTVFTRDSSDKFSGIIAPKGQVTSVLLSVDGYLAVITNPNSESYNMTYSTSGLLSTFQKPGAQVSSFTYDNEGNLTKDTHSGGYFFDLVRNLNQSKSSDITLTTRMGRVMNSVISETSNRILRTTSHIDGSSQVYDRIKYSGFSTVTSSLRGETGVSTITDDLRFGSMAGFETKFQYSSGPLYYSVYKTPSVSLSNPNDPFSILSYVVDIQKGSHVEKIQFDPSTKVFAGNSSLGRTKETSIDSYERITLVKKGNLTATELLYNNENLSKIKQGIRETSFVYNPTSGFLQSIENSLGQLTSYVYNSAGRLSSKIFPDLRTIIFSYDGNGNITGVTPPGRPSHVFNFNSSELLGAYEPPALTGLPSVNSSYSYDNDKHLIGILKPNGDVIQFTYLLGTGLLSQVTTPAGNYLYSVDSTTKLPSQIVSPSSNITDITYNGRVPTQISVRDPGFSFFNAYNVSISVDGLINSDTIFTKVGSSTINYTYDNDELLTGAGDLTLTKDTPNGMLTATSIGTSPNIVTDSYTYNSFGEVTGYQAKYGATVIYDLTLGRDGMGRINSKTQTMNSVTDVYDYTFDVTGRLTQTMKNSTVSATYGYDDNSNRNSGTIGSQPTTATYDAQDRMTAYNLLSFTYNANGELTSKTNTLTSTTTSYVYDVFGNLTSVTLPSTDVITYEIDGLNRRIGKKLNGVLQKRWVYMDQVRIAAELDSSGNIAKRFVYGSKGNIPDYMIMGGENYRIISDQLGSPRLVVKVSDGSVAGLMDHDEYGRVAVDTNPGLLPFGFAGGLYDSSTGLVRFGARDYDAETGRWTSKDPILFGGGDTNLFGYVQNDPINKFDPTGLSDLVLFNPADPITPYDSNIPSTPGYYSVGGHGNSSAMGDQNGNALTAIQVGALINGSPTYNGQDIQLNSCSTGAGSNSFAQQLANVTGKRVTAPTADLMMFPNGGTNVMGPNGWKTFAPSPVPYR